MGRDDFVQEHSRQYWGQRRDEIVDRVRESILDFTLLFDHLPSEQWADIFETEDGDWIGYEDEIFEEGARDAIAFILYAAELTEWSVFRGSYSLRALPVGPLFGGSLDRAAGKDGYLIDDWDLEVDATRAPEIARAKKTLEAGEKLHPVTIARLVRAGSLDDDRLQEFLREELVEKDD